jgi:hypothetical protein
MITGWIPVIPAKCGVNRTSRVVFAGAGGSTQARAARFTVATILYWIFRHDLSGLYSVV